MDYTAHQAPLSMGLSRQEYWSGLAFPSPGNLLDPGIEPGSPALRADSLPSELQGSSSLTTFPDGKEWTEEPGGLPSMGSQRVGYN